MSDTKIQKVLDTADGMPEMGSFTAYKPFMKALATELRALLAERDAWKAKAEAKTPTRKLREVRVNGWLYRVNNGTLESTAREGSGWHKMGSIEPSAIPLLAPLFADPYEPVEAVTAVIGGIIADAVNGFTANVETYAARLRAAVEAEGGRDV